MGYGKGAKYQEPNLYELYIKKLEENSSDILYLYKLQNLINELFEKLENKKQFIDKEKILALFYTNSLVDPTTTYLEYSLKSKEYFAERFNVFKNTYEIISPIFDKHRNKAYKQKYVDFNQGIDARLLTEKKMALLAKINIRPLRVAFDDIELKDIYTKKLKLAGKYGIKNSSNYILYNYTDTPEDLYERLKINIDLNQKEKLNIYSFPMKYLPIEDFDRKYVGEHWNKKYLRGMQVVLNAVHGAVMPGKKFFEVAFGKNEKEFKQILMYPEEYTFYRMKNKQNIINWKRDLTRLEKYEPENYKKIIAIIQNNVFIDIELEIYSKLEQKVLFHYVKKYKKYANYKV